MNIEERQVSAFLGQRSADDPGSLYIKKGVMAAQANSFLLTKGRRGLDGQTGIGANLATNSTSGLNGYGVRQYEWICGDGNTYHLFYRRNGTTCTIVYFKNGARTVAPTAMTYIDIAGSALTENSSFVVPQQTVPSWGVYGGALYLAMGQPGIFRINAKNGALTAQLTIAPASSKMLIVDNRMWVAVGDEPIIRWSALGDVERFTPKLAEIEANTYGIDYRVTLQSEGVAGNIVDCKMFGKAKVWWTQNECFVIYGSGDSSDTVFDKIGSGMGCNGQPIVRDNICAWPSKYKGGDWIALTFGSSVVGGEQIDVQDEKNIGFRTFSLGSKISDVLQAMPQTSVANAVVSWDTKPDWEAIPSAQRANLSASYEPGYLLSQVVDNVVTASWSVKRNSIWVWDASPNSNLNDSLPAYPNLTTPSVTSQTHTFGGSTLVDVMAVKCKDSAGVEVFTQTVTASSIVDTWKEFVVDKNNVATVEVVFSGFLWWAPLSLEYIGAVSGYVGKVRVLLDAFNTTTKVVTVSEIRVEGTGVTSATVYTEYAEDGSKAVMSGLAINSAADLGRFYTSYVGTDYDGTGGIAYYIRAGNTSYASLANGSLTFAGGTTLTDGTKNFTTSGVHIGDYVWISSVKYFITAVGTTTLGVNATLPTGFLAYVVMGGAPATWSTWTAVTTNDLLTGYDLKKLTYITSGNPLTSSATGTLYVQAYATFTITNGISPKLDAMFFTAQTGSNLTFGPSGFYDDKLFTCILTNSSSTAPDCELVRYLDGEHSVITGKKANSYLNTSDGDCLVAEGYALGKQYQGNYNYTGTDNSTETTLPRIWKGHKDSGLLYGGKFRLELDGFALDTGMYAIDKTQS